MDYPFKEIEEKWQGTWQENNSFSTEKSNLPKYYCLEMFPYPSGRIHMGHVRNYVIGDVIARFKKITGFSVMHPMGWDAFGLPAENAALTNNIHPAKWTSDNINYMKKQLKRLGLSYDWRREIATSEPDYYRWNQWLFLKLYEKGLAYRKEAEVNWCPKCQTVLANEQVENGKCWRCESEAGLKSLEQWFFKITEYSERLLSDLNFLGEWPENVITMQKNWIGKSEGTIIYFQEEKTESVISVFTTRPDTIFGATYLTLAPQYPGIEKLIVGAENEEEIRRFIEKAKIRTRENIEKEGIFTGAYAINPVNEQRVPIWIANYILMEYGTGAIMAVPAHDQRDFEFAKKYDLPIKVVIQPEGEILNIETMNRAYEEEGVLIGSTCFNGLKNREASHKISIWMEKEGIGKRETCWKLRDWLISRQRYWGTPIPIIYCEVCGIVPVLEEELPVLLPKETKPGETLADISGFVHCKCPGCGLPAKRETDTMDTFVDSSWYFLRYLSPADKGNMVSSEMAEYWMPVDQYIGGVEHAILHLLYARFITKVLFDIEVVNIKEPFINLLAQGMVIKDGAKMSKSKGNVVDPDEILGKYGADTMRLFILFASPPTKQLEWDDKGIEGCWRFINRIYRLKDRVGDVDNPESLRVHSQQSTVHSQQSTVHSLKIGDVDDPQSLRVHSQKTGDCDDPEILALLHKTIKIVSRDIEKFSFNTALARLMEFTNECYQKKVSKDSFKKFLLLLFPFAPHLASELLQDEALNLKWPSYDESLTKKEEILIVIQINGKLKARITVPSDISENELKERAKREVAINCEIRNIIVVPKRLVNIVC
ncbi:leucine--tRNA ligase [bacterium]|nr:leucine--tRNA ligase [bacterium]